MPNDTLRKEILSAVEAYRDQAIEFLSALVSIPSVTGDEAAIQQLIIARLEAMGLEMDVFEPDSRQLQDHPAYIREAIPYEGRPNVVGIWRGSGSEGGRSLLCNGHVDVIPTGDPEAWNHAPWSADIAEGRLYGRGSSDMKSGIAAMTMATEILRSAGYRIKGDLILEYTVDEEDTGNGTLACVLRGYTADAGICCETSSLHVQPACIGRIWFEINLKGKPAGIQKRFEGVSALDKACLIVEAVKDFEARRLDEVRHPLYPDIVSSIPCMITMVQSGSFPSSFPDTAVLKGSIATVPGERTAEVKAKFSRHILDTAARDSWLKDHLPTIEYNGYCGDPADIPPDHPIVQTLSRACREVTGLYPPVTGRQGAADTRYLINYGNTPTVIFGPGLTEQMHSTNEFVEVEDLMTAVGTLALAIADWCGIEETGGV